jgi:MFS family permease
MTTPTSTETTEQPAGEVLHCANHPDVETYLRCNKCGKPICLKCAELTEVGYRCKECIREQQNVFYTAMTKDNWIALAVAAGVTLVAWPIAAFFLRFLGLFFGLIVAALVGSGAGAALGQIIRNSVGRRRGRNLRFFALAGAIIGIILSAFITTFALDTFAPLLSWQGLLFAVLALAATYQLLK